jgi:ABC-type transport system substrate-binding protein
LNKKAKYFDDVNVRRAVMMAIDPNQIIKDAKLGHATRAYFQMLSVPGSPWYIPDIKHLEFDPAKAKQSFCFALSGLNSDAS